MAKDGAVGGLPPEAVALIEASRSSIDGLLRRMNPRNATAILRRISVLSSTMANAVRVVAPLVAVQAAEEDAEAEMHMEDAWGTAEPLDDEMSADTSFGGIVAERAMMARPPRMRQRGANDGDLAAKVVEDGLAGFAEFMRLQHRQKALETLSMARRFGDVALASAIEAELGLSLGDLPATVPYVAGPVPHVVEVEGGGASVQAVG